MVYGMLIRDDWSGLIPYTIVAPLSMVGKHDGIGDACLQKVLDGSSKLLAL